MFSMNQKNTPPLSRHETDSELNEISFAIRITVSLKFVRRNWNRESDIKIKMRIVTFAPSPSLIALHKLPAETVDSISAS